MTVIRIFTIIAALCIADISYAQSTVLTSTAQSPVEAVAAVPFVKIRQGEKFKLFDGGGGGVKYSPWLNSNSPAKDVYFSGVLLLSSATLPDPSSTGGTTEVNILSAGLVVGYQWLQIGYGRDLVSSESKTAFDQRQKSFLMLNLGASIKF